MRELGGIQFLKHIPAGGSSFLLGKTDFSANGNHFFLNFLETPTSDSFFPSSRKVFFNEIFHSGQWKRILALVETVFFCLMETVTEISQLFKKGDIITNEN